MKACRHHTSLTPSMERLLHAACVIGRGPVAAGSAIFLWWWHWRWYWMIASPSTEQAQKFSGEQRARLPGNHEQARKRERKHAKNSGPKSRRPKAVRHEGK